MAAAPPEMWQALIQHFEKMRAGFERDLEPLKSGKMRTGHCGADTGFVWVDITQQSIMNLENAIIGLTNAIERVKAEHA